MVKIYCEPGALSPELRALQRAGAIELVHFPYDPDLRTKDIAPSATPSEAQWRDLNTTWDELGGSWDDFEGSEHHAAITKIIGAEHRRDILHMDSAYKSECAALITADSDILDHTEELEALLGIRIFNGRKDVAAAEQFIRGLAGSQGAAGNS